MWVVDQTFKYIMAHNTQKRMAVFATRLESVRVGIAENGFLGSGIDIQAFKTINCVHAFLSGATAAFLKSRPNMQE